MDNNVVVYIKQTFNEIGLGTTYNDVLKKKLGAFDVIDVPLFPELKKLLNTELVTFTLNSTMTATIDYDDPDKFKKVMTSGPIVTGKQIGRAHV